MHVILYSTCIRFIFLGNKNKRNESLSSLVYSRDNLMVCVIHHADKQRIKQ